MTIGSPDFFTWKLDVPCWVLDIQFFVPSGDSRLLVAMQRIAYHGVMTVGVASGAVELPNTNYS